MAKILLALGGNALDLQVEMQLLRIKEAMKNVADLIEEGHEVILTHGNGPQVGMIRLAMEYASEKGAIPTAMPFAECNAMSQGYIGFHMQNALRNELLRRGIRKTCVSLVTQVLVDEKDAAFQNPTKPIGAFYTQEEAAKLIREKGYVMKEDSGRGYRRLVASPKPVEIVEKDIIRSLMVMGNVVIACGGGGIAVVEREDGYTGVDAVIDKDFAAAKLAMDIGIDKLVILTSVDGVFLHYNTPEELFIKKMSVEEALYYTEQGHFAKGSMLPKIQAGIDFALWGGETIIASLENVRYALKGEHGTKIAS